MNFREMNPEQAQTHMQETPGLQLLDVREPFEFQRAHIEGVTLIPLGELQQRYQELNPDRPVLCICAAGVRSERAAMFLSSAGFSDVTNMVEGMKGWQGRGLPTS